ncbi:hypothetical protein GEV33_002162 [Tenebrio molitor]|uniref:Uncharacterized protein n=1 Tax=Tenebrio molitor TaxID=7067 RepID=A0A8J6LF23_TENMO|nr:hypothetical protein GEV33_002162 [Tenebrio molitor]
MTSNRKIHPKNNANFLSHFLFCWQLRILWKKQKNKFTEDDVLVPVEEHESQNLGDKLETLWFEEENFCKEPSLTRALIKLFGLEFALYGLVYFPLDLVIALVPPIFLKQYLDYFLPNGPPTMKEAAFAGLFIVLSVFLRVLTFNFMLLQLSSFGMKMRIACCSLVYRKLLKLKTSTVQKITLGQIVNLLSNDAERFDKVFPFLHLTWISPVKIIVVGRYLVMTYGYYAIGGMVVPVLCILLNILVSKKISSTRQFVAVTSDSRIRLLSNIINGINAIKMFTWEKPFAALVDIARNVKWDASLPNYVLKDATFKAKSSELVAVIGTAGSGKSTLLQVILKEITVLRGDVVVKGSLSYTPQQPWIFTGSVRDNILFGEPMDKQKYQEVIRVRCLEHDLSLFPHGDNSLVGERGMLLSGGQKARISLARAVYREADIYLLDDPLSAVDVHVANQIFYGCIRDYLKDKCVILVTHQIQFLQDVDKVLLLEKGKISTCHKFDKLEMKKTDKKSFSNDVIIQQHDSPSETLEDDGSGTVNAYKSFCFSGGTPTTIALILLFFVLTQTLSSLFDYLLAIWINLKQKSEELDKCSTSSSVPFEHLGFCGFLQMRLQTITRHTLPKNSFRFDKLFQGSLLGTCSQSILQRYGNCRRVYSCDIVRRRSPIFTHVSASVQGLDVIRSFKAETRLRLEFDKLQNGHSSAWYFHKAFAYSQAFWTDLACSFYTFIIMFYLLFFKNGSSVGHVGLSVTQSIVIIGLVQYVMKCWGEFEYQMTSVERIVEYADVTPEEDNCTCIPHESWPKHGELAKKLEFYQQFQFFGIVGRTGAGKSSIISTLFRLYNFDGTIFIDGVDIKTVPLHTLRSKIAIIPQEPILFLGTLRQNLDPFDEYSDSQLWSALEDVDLKEVVSGLPSGLDSRVLEGGCNFSVGQRQLLCLVRAILKNAKIVALDEATASVDLATDETVQRTIRMKCQDSTVLTIAHRLNTVMDADKILVMESGKVVEFGSTETLLQNRDSRFYNYVFNSDKIK